MRKYVKLADCEKQMWAMIKWTRRIIVFIHLKYTFSVEQMLDMVYRRERTYYSTKCDVA